MEKNSDMVQIVVKGAPEYVLPMCTKQVDARGNPKALPHQSMEHILTNTIANSCCKN
jgi:P-type Ca2+ transporter type 2B